MDKQCNNPFPLKNKEFLEIHVTTNEWEECLCPKCFEGDKVDKTLVQSLDI